MAQQNALADLLGTAVQQVEQRGDETDEFDSIGGDALGQITIVADTSASAPARGTAPVKQRIFTQSGTTSSAGTEAEPLQATAGLSLFGRTNAVAATAKALREGEAPEVDEFADEEVEFQIGSAAVQPVADDSFSDDESVNGANSALNEEGDKVPALVHRDRAGANSSHNSSSSSIGAQIDPSNASGVASPTAVVAPTVAPWAKESTELNGGAERQKGVTGYAAAGTGLTAAALCVDEEELRERDRQAQLEAAEQARLKAEAAKAAEAAAAEAEAEVAAAARAAQLQEERKAALRAITAAGDDTTPTHVAKTAAEKADEAFLLARNNIGAIAEDEDEEGEGEGEGDGKGQENDGDGDGGGASPGPAASNVDPTDAISAMLAAQFDAATQAVEQSTAAQGRGKRGVRTDAPTFAAAEGEGGDTQTESLDMRYRKVLYTEASSALCEADMASEMEAIIREDWSSASLLTRLIPLFRPKLRTDELREQRDKLMAIAKVPLGEVPMHERILYSCYRALTGESTCPPRFGPHWELIGFQGDDPATDLRGAGMLSLLQVMHFSSKRPQLLQEIYRTSRRDGADFPFMVVSINMTQLTLGALRAGVLTKACNRNKQVYDTVHTFYEACYLHMFEDWKSNHCTIVDFDRVKKDVARLSLQKPADLFKRLEGWSPAGALQLEQGAGFADLG